MNPPIPPYHEPMYMTDVEARMGHMNMQWVLYFEALKNYKGDLTVSSTSAFYLGDSDTDGSWRLIRSGNNLNVERRESSVWVAKGVFIP